MCASMLLEAQSLFEVSPLISLHFTVESWPWSSPFLASLASQLVLGISCLCLPSTGTQVVAWLPSFDMLSGGLNSSSHAFLYPLSPWLIPFPIFF